MRYFLFIGNIYFAFYPDIIPSGAHFFLAGTLLGYILFGHV